MFLEDWYHVLCIFDLGTQGTMQFLELGRAREIAQLIPFKTIASLCLYISKVYLSSSDTWLFGVSFVLLEDKD